MDDVSTLQFTVQQQNQRISALEELLRRTEGSLTAVLTRVKDAEIGMNALHRLLSQTANENIALAKELATAKQRAEIIDRAWRSHCQQSEAALWNEVRNSKPPPPSQDPTVSRMLQEIAQQRAQLGDIEIGLNRVSDAQASDSNALRLCEQHVQNAEGQLGELVALQREGAKDTIRRFEQLFHEAGQHRADTDRAVAALKQQQERQARDAAAMLEQQAVSLAGFQQDAGASIRAVREEVATGLGQAFQSLRDTEAATKTLEQILRAEVQTRAQAVEQTNRKVAGVEQTLNARVSPLVNNHHTDISRLWDAIRSSQYQRQQTERLDNILSGVNNETQSGAGAGAVSFNNNNISRNAGNNNNMSALHSDALADQDKDLEISTSERFDLVDNHILQLAETLKRAHSGVEEQVESLASRFGRMEMRLESIASRRDQQQQKDVDKLVAMMKSQQPKKTDVGGVNNSTATATGTNNIGGDDSSEAIIKEVVETRLRVDRVEASVEEVKFDVSDLLDAISAETTELTKRLENLEKKTNNGTNSTKSTNQQQQQNSLANVHLRSSGAQNSNNNNNSFKSPKTNQRLLNEFTSGGAGGHTEVIDTSSVPQNDDVDEV
jgi:hypothetical protein